MNEERLARLLTLLFARRLYIHGPTGHYCEVVSVRDDLTLVLRRYPAEQHHDEPLISADPDEIREPGASS